MSSNNTLLYNILLTKINEYIDTIAINKKLQDAITKANNTKANNGYVKKEIELFKELFKTEFDQISGNSLLKKNLTKNPDSLYADLQKALTANLDNSFSNTTNNKYFRNNSVKQANYELWNNKLKINNAKFILEIAEREFELSNFKDSKSMFYAIYNPGNNIPKYAVPANTDFNQFIKDLTQKERTENATYNWSSVTGILGLSKDNSFHLKKNEYEFINKLLKFDTKLNPAVSSDTIKDFKFNLLEFLLFLNITYSIYNNEADKDLRESSESDFSESSSNYTSLHDFVDKEYTRAFNDKSVVEIFDKLDKKKNKTIDEAYINEVVKNIDKNITNVNSSDVNSSASLYLEFLSFYSITNKKLDTFITKKNIMDSIIKNQKEANRNFGNLNNPDDTNAIFTLNNIYKKIRIITRNSITKSTIIQTFKFSKCRSILNYLDEKVTKKLREKLEHQIRVAEGTKLLDEAIKSTDSNVLAQKIIQNNIGDENIVQYVIQDLLQSITGTPSTTPEILSLLNKYVNPIINFIRASQNADSGEEFANEEAGLKIVYLETEEVTSKLRNAERLNTFKIQKEVIDSNKAIPGLGLSKDSNTHVSRYGIENTNSSLSGYYNIDKILFKDKESQGNTTNMCCILVNNPLLRISARNELDLSVFLNLLSTAELSKCSPYLEMNLELPSTTKLKGKTLSINTLPSYLYGSTTTSSSESVSPIFNALSTRVSDDTVSANMSLFSAPQTLNNFNEKNFERQGDFSHFERFNNVFDTTRPFLSLKSFTIDVAPTQGLMSFKTGKVSLVLHDKSRMIDVAQFIKPDLFGVHGSEIAVTYGWSSIEDNYSKNFLGSFLNDKKVTEKYIITNSSFNMTKNGEVNIDLSVAMRGPVDLKSIEINESAKTKVLLKGIETSYAAIKETIGDMENSVVVSINGTTSEETLGKEFDVEISIIDSIYNFVKGLNTSNFSDKKNNSNNINDKYVSLNVENIKEVCDDLKSTNERWHILKNGFINALGSQDPRKALTGEEGELKDLVNYLKDSARLDNAKDKPRIAGTIKIDLGPGFYAYQGKEDKDDYNSRYPRLFKSLTQRIADFASEVLSYIDNISKFIKETKSFVEEIIQGLGIEDPFYDRKLAAELNALPAVGNTEIKDVRISEEKLTIQKTDFVTLGTFITGIIGSQLAMSTNYDDIQIVSYCANQNAGLMSGKNLLSFLLRRDTLNQILEELFIDTDAVLTLEGFLAQVIEREVNTESNNSYGLYKLFKISSEGVVSPKFENPKIQEKNKTQRLQTIYTKILKIKDPSDSNIKFKRPKVRLSFDTLLAGELKEKTILRVSVYDDNDNPFEAVSDLFIKDADNLLLKAGGKIGMYKATEKSSVANAKSKAVIDKLIEQEIIKIEEGTISLTTEGKKLIPLKSEIKRNIPSVTYGTQNSGIVEASVTTVNEAKLNTVFLTRTGDNTAKIKSNLKQEIDMPLNILPAQASITMFGCPFINFAQFMFLDFETGTTLDNIYAVTGIKHDFAPGRFMTTLTMSYGDIYGKYRNTLDLLEQSSTDSPSTTQITSQTDTAQDTSQQEDQRQVSSIKHLTPDLTLTINKSERDSWFESDTLSRAKSVFANANINIENYKFEPGLNINEQLNDDVVVQLYTNFDSAEPDNVYVYYENTGKKQVLIFMNLQQQIQSAPVKVTLDMQKLFDVENIAAQNIKLFKIDNSNNVTDYQFLEHLLEKELSLSLQKLVDDNLNKDISTKISSPKLSIIYTKLRSDSKSINKKFEDIKINLSKEEINKIKKQGIDEIIKKIKFSGIKNLISNNYKNIKINKTSYSLAVGAEKYVAFQKQGSPNKRVVLNKKTIRSILNSIIVKKKF